MLLTPTYVHAVLKLSCSLRQVYSRYPLLVLYDAAQIGASVLDQLHNAGINTQAVELISFPNSFADRFSINWTKLRLWQLTQYDRVVYMDSDMFVAQNIDELFTLPADVPLAVAVDTDRHCNNCGPMGMNQAGLLVLTPCAATYDAMLSLARSDVRYQFQSTDAEQGFLNHYWKFNRMLLPPAYNFLPHQLYEEKGLRSLAKVYHYTARKPFAEGASEANLPYHQQWFDCPAF